MPKSNGKIAPAKDKNENFLVRIILRIVPDWITPNIISVLRLAMIPLIVAYMAMGFYKTALLMFIIAALLDTLDGTLARARQQISDWGMILDPLADKLLIMTIIAFLLMLYPFKLLIIYVFVFDLLILLVSAFQLNQYKTSEIKPIQPSNFWGKSKMLAQVTGISLALLWLAFPIVPILYGSAMVIWLSLALQIKSAVSYG